MLFDNNNGKGHALLFDYCALNFFHFASFITPTYLLTNTER